MINLWSHFLICLIFSTWYIIKDRGDNLPLLWNFSGVQFETHCTSEFYKWTRPCCVQYLYVWGDVEAWIAITNWMCLYFISNSYCTWKTPTGILWVWKILQTENCVCKEMNETRFIYELQTPCEHCVFLLHVWAVFIHEIYILTCFTVSQFL